LKTKVLKKSKVESLRSNCQPWYVLLKSGLCHFLKSAFMMFADIFGFTRKICNAKISRWMCATTLWALLFNAKLSSHHNAEARLLYHSCEEYVKIH